MEPQDLIDAWNTRPTVRPALKPLAFTKRDERLPDGATLAADCPFGRYYIVDRGEFGFGWKRAGSYIFMGFEPSEAAAISAAQADYEKRVLSCLEDTPADPWLPIETAPKDGYFFEAWHVIHKCWVSVKFLDTPWNGCELIEKTMTSTWPLAVFSYWKRSTPPTQQETE